MKKNGISQEGLKAIACVSMLFDHLGVVFFPSNLWLRLIGRLAFPIYCFLLSEGIHHTKNPKKYGLRLALGMLLAELPFDFALYGGFTWAHQSVMVTLLLAFIMGVAMKNAPLWLKPLIAIPFAVLAEVCRSDYGAVGVLTVAVFLITREMEERNLFQTCLLALLNLWLVPVSFIQPVAVAAMGPILAYSGEKKSGSKLGQAAFYLFYPGHLLLLWLLKGL